MNRVLIAALLVSGICASPFVKRQAEDAEGVPAEAPPPPAAADSPPAPPPPKPQGPSGPTARQASGDITTYNLPAGAELLIPSIRSSFSCDGRIYGYYADVDNDCRIFHVCLPVEAEDGHQSSLMYSFFCGNKTVFDQEDLVCAHEEDAFPCDQAASAYDSINSRFGITDAPGNRPPPAPRSAPLAAAPAPRSAPLAAAPAIPASEAEVPAAANGGADGAGAATR